MDGHEEFERKIAGSLNKVQKSIACLNGGVKGLQASFKSFHDDITDYLAFSAEKYADHEKRLTALERKLNQN